MSRSRLYQYAILWHPKEEAAVASSEGTVSKVLVDVTTVLAKDEKSVAIMASKKIDDKYMDQLDQIEVVVKPF